MWTVRTLVARVDDGGRAGVEVTREMVMRSVALLAENARKRWYMHTRITSRPTQQTYGVNAQWSRKKNMPRTSSSTGCHGEARGSKAGKHTCGKPTSSKEIWAQLEYAQCRLRVVVRRKR
jgi:hypothetical protein